MTPGLEQQLCYEIKTFLLAGHETSAAMLSWSLYELTQHPDALAKVRRGVGCGLGLSGFYLTACRGTLPADAAARRAGQGAPWGKVFGVGGKGGARGLCLGFSLNPKQRGRCVPI